MTIKYTINQNDFINLNLFLTRRIPRLMKQANIQKYTGCILLISLALVYGILFNNYHDLSDLVISLILILLCFLYPKINLWLFKRSQKHRFKIIEKRDGKSEVALFIDSNELSISDKNGKYSIKTSEILSIVEVSNYIFIQLGKELFISVPKDQIDNILEINKELDQYIEKYGIPYTIKNDWSNNIYSKKSLI